MFRSIIAFIIAWVLSIIPYLLRNQLIYAVGWGRNGQDIMHICMAIEHNTVVAKEPHVCCQAIR